MAKEKSKVGSTGENRNLERVGNVAGTFSNTGGYMGVDGINNLIQEKFYSNSLANNLTQPVTDPTFTSGLNYAQSIAGGENVPNMIAPGVSYSAASPQGYTQMDLPPIVSGLPNIVTDTPPDRAFLPGLFSKANATLDNMQKFIAQNPDKTRQGGVDFTGESLRKAYDEGRGVLQKGRYNPLDLTGIQSILDSFKGDVGGPALDKSLIVDQDVIERPLIRGLENRDSMDDFMSIERINQPPIEDINIPEIPDISQFIMDDNLPVFEEPRFIEDINTFNNIDPFLNQPMIPNGSDFSIERLPFGLLR
jgi:hypothetical protein